MKITRIGIIGAMDVEVSALYDSMIDATETPIAGMIFRKGNIGEVPVVVVKSGIGKVNAAICAQILIDRFGVDHIINTGVAGSLNNKIAIGDVVISTDTMYHDMDATLFGYERGQVPGMDTLTFPADPEFRELIHTAVVNAAHDIRVFSGRVVSGDFFISSKNVKDFIRKSMDGMCVDMESTAIAHTAYVNKVPFVIVRFISDNAEDESGKAYDEFEAEAAEHSANILKNALLQIQNHMNRE